MLIKQYNIRFNIFQSRTNRRFFPMGLCGHLPSKYFGQQKECSLLGFLYYNITLKYLISMSEIIQLEQHHETREIQNVNFFKESLKAIFRKQYVNECKEISDSGRQIIISLAPSQYTYRLSTLWLFQLDKPYLTLRVSFFNKQQDDFLRGTSQRLRFEAYLLTRRINTTVMGYQFKIDSQSGILRVQYAISWAIFEKVFSKQQNISNFIKTICNFMRRYDQLMVFLEPSMPALNKQNDSSAKRKAHKFRYIIKARKNMRINLHSSIGDLFRMKEIKEHIKFQNLNKVRSMFMQSIQMYYQSNIEDQAEYKQDDLNRQMLSIQKNQNGISSTKIKIVMGILRIKEESESGKIQLSDEGAHAKIFCNKFKYSVVETLYKGTVAFDSEVWKCRAKELKTDLAYKICNEGSEASKNSFKNELAVLKNLKEDNSPYIARYYLMVKQQWDEKDIIYMTRYKKNLYSYLENYKGISIKNKLILAYGIAKGLCFLSSKNIIHRDFKPHNVLIENMVPKIIDFGSAAPKHNSTNIQVFDDRLLFTEGFHIPYSVANAQIKAKMSMQAYDKHPLFDVFAFGRTLCFLFFHSFNPPMPEAIENMPHREMLQHILFIIYMCLQADPDERPILGEITAYLGILPDLMKSQIDEQFNSQQQSPPI